MGSARALAIRRGAPWHGGEPRLLRDSAWPVACKGGGHEKDPIYCRRRWARGLRGRHDRANVGRSRRGRGRRRGRRAERRGLRRRGEDPRRGARGRARRRWLSDAPPGRDRRAVQPGREGLRRRLREPLRVLQRAPLPARKVGAPRGLSCALRRGHGRGMRPYAETRDRRRRPGRAAWAATRGRPSCRPSWGARAARARTRAARTPRSPRRSRGRGTSPSPSTR